MNYFQASYFLFLLLGFFLTPSPVWAMTFYACAAPLTLREAWKRGGTGFDPKDGLAWLSLATIVWFGLTLIWGVNQTGPRIGQYALAVATNAIFVIGGLLFFGDEGNPWKDRLFRCFPLAAAVNVLVSCVHFYGYLGNPFGSRLTGWAETRHQILGSDIICVAAIISLRNLFDPAAPRERPAMRLLQIFCVLAAGIFVILSGSRGSFVALAFSAGLFLWLIRPRIAVLALLCLAALGGGLLLASPFLRQMIMENVLRDPMRLHIWAITLDYAAARPLLGYGVATVATFGDDSLTFPHSMYFSALFYGGVIGLALVAALLASVVMRVLRRAKGAARAFPLALMAIPLVAGLTDTGQFIKNPTPQWYIVWLPIIIAMATARPPATTAPSASDGAEPARPVR